MSLSYSASPQTLDIHAVLVCVSLTEQVHLQQTFEHDSTWKTRN